jgi:hypothetical protein
MLDDSYFMKQALIEAVKADKADKAKAPMHDASGLFFTFLLFYL